MQTFTVQPWVAGSVGAVHLVFSSQVHPSSHGINSQPCPSERGPPTRQRESVEHVYPSAQVKGRQVPSG